MDFLTLPSEEDTFYLNRLKEEGLEKLSFWSPKLSYQYHKKDLRILINASNTYGFKMSVGLREYSDEEDELLSLISNNVECSYLLNKIDVSMGCQYYVVTFNDRNHLDYYDVLEFPTLDNAKRYVNKCGSRGGDAIIDLSKVQLPGGYTYMIDI